MNLSVEERQALQKKLLEVTREGTITGWAERIARAVRWISCGVYQLEQVARNGCIPCDGIR